MFRVLYVFTKSLSRIAKSLEQIAALYQLELKSRGIVQADSKVHDEVEVMYGYHAPADE